MIAELLVVFSLFARMSSTAGADRRVASTQTNIHHLSALAHAHPLFGLCGGVWKLRTIYATRLLSFQCAISAGRMFASILLSHYYDCRSVAARSDSVDRVEQRAWRCGCDGNRDERIFVVVVVVVFPPCVVSPHPASSTALFRRAAAEIQRPLVFFGVVPADNLLRRALFLAIPPCAVGRSRRDSLRLIASTADGIDRSSSFSSAAAAAYSPNCTAFCSSLASGSLCR